MTNRLEPDLAPEPSPPPRLHAWSGLGFRLFLLLAGITIAGYALFSIRTTAERWRETVRMGAQRNTTVIEKSTYYGMLLNRKEDVHQIIRTIAEAPGVGRSEHLRQSGHPINNQPACSDADCHAHPPEQTVLGVLDVKMSMTDADAGLTAISRQIATAAVATTLLVGLFSAVFINVVVRRPVQRLMEGTSKVAHGDLTTELHVRGHDEIGQLAQAFNGMIRDLRRARRENEEWARTLEQKIVEKTEELSRSQRQVVHMEKMASLGRLAATVAHLRLRDETGRPRRAQSPRPQGPGAAAA